MLKNVFLIAALVCGNAIAGDVSITSNGSEVISGEPVAGGRLVKVTAVDLSETQAAIYQVATPGVDTLQVGNDFYVVTPCTNGDVAVFVTTVEVVKIRDDVYAPRVIESQQRVIAVDAACEPGEPDKPPKPEPDPTANDCDPLPADEFKNVGRFACESLAAVPDESIAKRSDVAAAYRKTAEATRAGGNPELVEFSDYLEALRANVDAAVGSSGQGWREWRSRLAAFTAGLNLQKADFDNYCDAVAAGL